MGRGTQGGSIVNSFTTRYAVRMPNGELYSRPTAYSLFGVPDPTSSSRVVAFDTRESAETFIARMRREAADIGIDWQATIVQQLCTPFTSGDPTEQFAGEVIDWLREQA